MYERILVPTDGSEYAETAAETAFELAVALEAAVTVICVIEAGPLGSVTLPGEEASATEILTERATTFVTRVAERGHAKGVDVSTDVCNGLPVEEILAYAEETNADLIVLGSRGRGGVSKLLLGSVTDGVTRRSDRDVLVVGDDATETGR